MKIAEHAFPARSHNAPGSLVLRRTEDEGGLEYVVHWRNALDGGLTGGTYSADLASGRADFERRVKEEMDRQPVPVGPFVVEMWLSHRDLRNDDCMFRETEGTLEAALALAEEFKTRPGHPDDRWGYVNVEGPDGVVREELNTRRPRVSDDLDLSEAAHQAGMGHGVQGWNEVLGQDVEEEPAFRP